MRSFPEAFVAALAVTLCWPQTGRAEANETTVGLSGGVLLPAFKSPSPTAFALATWAAGFEAQYGVTESLYLRGSFLFSAFSATAQAKHHEYDGRTYSGPLSVDGTYYHPELGARLKLLGGFNLAPYAELNTGFLWGVFHKAELDAGAGTMIAMGDFAQGAITLGAGVALDYRLFELLFAGVAVRYVHVFGAALAQHYVSVPLQMSLYW